MPVFAVKDATDLFMKQADHITQLWTLFVAASFAASGFGVTSEHLHWAIRLGVTVAYAAFAYGHFTMIRDAVEAHAALAKTLNGAVRDQDAFHPAIVALTKNADMKLAIPFHLVVDVAVGLALWSRPLEEWLTHLATRAT
jgi:hypothetical protein